MARLKREQLLLLTLVIAIIIVGCGVLVWQKLNNQPLVIDARSGTVNSPVRTEDEQVKDKQTGTEVGGVAGEIIVHVAGEVVHPGVYQLPGDARVYDAVQAAGGETVLAELDSMNLAQFLTDGERIYIPAIREGTAGLPVSERPGSVSSFRINVNLASAEELQTLNGIGPSKAEGIIKYRDRVGGFKDKQQLLEVSGIGEKTLEKFIDDIVVR